MLITFWPSRVTIWWFMHHRTSGKSLLMDQMYKTYAEGMTEEKLIFKCVTGGKHHRSSLTFHFFLGLGFLDINKLDSQMNRFHSQKVVEATDGLEKGRLNSKRRKTILRENNIFDILKSLSRFPNQKKMPPYSFIC